MGSRLDACQGPVPSASAPPSSLLFPKHLTRLLYTSSTQASAFCCSLQECLSTSTSSHLRKKGQLNASLTGILSPTRCRCSAPSSASHLGCELPILHLSQKVLSHFLTFIMAVSSACECLGARTLIFFLLPLAWHPFMRPTNILRSYNVPGSLLGARMQE